MPQSNIKTISIVLTIILSILAIGSVVYAVIDSTKQLDSAIVAHDTCETAHPGIRAIQVKTSDKVEALADTVNSIRTQQLLMAKDIKAILKAMDKLNHGDSP